MPHPISRRSLTRGAAWAVPTVIVATAGPAFAASQCTPDTATRTESVTTVLYTQGEVAIGGGSTDLAVLDLLIGTQTTDAAGNQTLTAGGLLPAGTTWTTVLSWTGLPEGTAAPSLNFSGLGQGVTATVTDAAFSSAYPANPDDPYGAKLVDLTVKIAMTASEPITGETAGRITWEPIVVDGTPEISARAELAQPADEVTAYAEYDSSTGECVAYVVTVTV